MATVNIGKDKNDASYRYKRERVQTKIEGSGNGIRSVVVNMASIARSLFTDVRYPTKYLGMEFGAQSKYDTKRDVAIINGKFSAGDFDKAIERFIDTFVLCPSCGLPELNMKVKRDHIKVDCTACGHNGPLRSSHKLTTYIIKNPPKKVKSQAAARDDDGALGGVDDGDKKKKRKRSKREKKEKKEKDKKSKKKDKKDKKKKKKKKKDKSKDRSDEDNDDEDNNNNSGNDDDSKDNGNDDNDSNDSDESESTASSSAASSSRKSSSKRSKKDEVVWYTDTSKEAQEKRRLAESAEMLSENKSDVIKSVDSILARSSGSAAAGGGKQDAATVLKIFLVSKEDRHVNEITSELRRLQLARGFDEPSKVRALLTAIIDPEAPPKSVPKAFKKYADVIRELANSSATGASVVLACIEEVLCVTYPKLKKLVPFVLQVLYDEDALEEEAITAWYNSPPESSWLVDKELALEARQLAKPLVEWFSNADEESSSGSDDDDDDDDE